jgi:hypothetical protein
VSLGELANDGKSEPAPCADWRLTVHSSRERDPDLIASASGYSRTFVIDCEADRRSPHHVLLSLCRLYSQSCVTTRQRDDYVAAGRAVLHCVVEKIERDLAERLAVYESLDVVVETLRYPDVFGTGQGDETRNHFSDERCKILPSW